MNPDSRSDLLDLSGQVALVTGASRGIGRATAEIFSSKGAKTALVARNPGPLNELAASLSDGGAGALAIAADVAVEADVQRVVDQTLETFGRIDILVNNAGLISFGHVADIDPSEWARVIGANLTGAYLCSRAVASAMVEREYGRIINISSVAGLVGGLTSSAYSASKGAVRLFTKSTAIQYAGEGIRANSIHPGAIDTDMGDEVWANAETRDEVIARTPVGRMGVPADIAYGALYLASDESSFVTGSELVIDGGMFAQ